MLCKGLVEALYINGKALLCGQLLGQLDWETESVVQLECAATCNLLYSLLLHEEGHFLKLLLSLLQGLAELDLLFGKLVEHFILVLNQLWIWCTIQVDYNLPERFQLEYTGSDNEKHRPVMIHRAPFGSMERFIAVLIEHTAGQFPLWLLPEQVALLPISEKFNDYAEEVCRYLNTLDIRATVDSRNEKIGRKVRDNELKRIPYMLIVGEKEMNEGTVSVRKKGEGDLGAMKMNDFANKIIEEVRSMTENF